METLIIDKPIAKRYSPHLQSVYRPREPKVKGVVLNKLEEVYILLETLALGWKGFWITWIILAKFFLNF